MKLSVGMSVGGMVLIINLYSRMESTVGLGWGPELYVERAES